MHIGGGTKWLFNLPQITRGVVDFVEPDTVTAIPQLLILIKIIAELTNFMEAYNIELVIQDTLILYIEGTHIHWRLEFFLLPPELKV